MTERAQNADFRRKPQIFADSPLLLEIQAFGGRRTPQRTADFRRKPQETADWASSPYRCVTFSSALVVFVLLKSWDAIPRMNFAFRKSLSEFREILREKNAREHSESSRNGLFTLRAFFLKLGLLPGFWITDLFSRILLSFLSSLLAARLPRFVSAPLFCRAKGTVQSLEKGSFRMELSAKLGKEIPSRNLREKWSGYYSFLRLYATTKA